MKLIKRGLAVLLTAFLAIATVQLSRCLYTFWEHDVTRSASASMPPLAPREPSLQKEFNPFTLSSPNAVLMRCSDQMVIMDKNAGEQIYPASMTKIMTVLIAVESIDPDRIVRLPDDFDALYQAGASMAGFSPGEQVKALDLFYGAMLPSGADACAAIAQEVSGSQKAFVRLMNERAKSLGLKHTHFTNVDGLHDPNHYSTAKDIARLLHSALDNPVFSKVFTAERYDTKPTKAHPDGLHLVSTLFGTGTSTAFDGGSILGGKTGFTDEAGLCLASLAEKDGARYILVTAGAPGDHTTKPLHILDALSVYGSLSSR